MQLERALQWLAADPDRRVLMVQQSDRLACIDFDDGRAVRIGVANRRAWWLLHADAASRCRGPAAGVSPAPVD